MPPGMTVSRLRSYVAAVRAGSRRAMRDPAITIVVLWRTPPRPSRTVPARIVMVGAWARARTGSRASSMGGLRDDGSGTRPTYAAVTSLSSLPAWPHLVHRSLRQRRQQIDRGRQDEG